LTPNSSAIYFKIAQLSSRTFGALAVRAYLTIYSPTNLGLTSSDRDISSSFIGFTTLISPILSDRKGIIHPTALLFTLSQFAAMVPKRAIASLIKFILLSFQSFILAFRNLATASRITGPACLSMISWPKPLIPSTLSYHLASSNLAVISGEKNSRTFSKASALSRP
jgi:hypothetical protein